MDLRIDSIKDILAHYGICNGRQYVSDILVHGVSGAVLEEHKWVNKKNEYTQLIQKINKKINALEEYIDKNKQYKKYLESRRSEMAKTYGALSAYKKYNPLMSSQDEKNREAETKIKSLKEERYRIDNALKYFDEKLRNPDHY